MLSMLIARVLLRYCVGILTGIFFLSDEVAQRLATDPDVVQLTSMLLAAVGTVLAEGLYFLAKRYGWRT